YLHISEFKVNVGDRVKRGQVIATVGNTGLSTACHLHFAMYENGVNTDPEKRLP
ncbi:M23 family metallopeptidase, partial [Citrobacter sp. AAK_AS5]